MPYEPPKGDWRARLARVLNNVWVQIVLALVVFAIGIGIMVVMAWRGPGPS